MGTTCTKTDGSLQLRETSVLHERTWEPQGSLNRRDSGDTCSLIYTALSILEIILYAFETPAFQSMGYDPLT